MTNEPSPKRRRIVKQYALRIDQVPFDKTYESLCDELKSFLVGELVPGDDVNFVLHFLCRRDENFSCATATFHTPISAGDLATKLNSACIPRSYHFDASFLGITPLYESPKGADVDVIAVPGLASHAIGSWKSRNGQDVWLRDYLPHDIDGIRVLIYGYNTSLLGSASKESIVDLGTGFLESVKAFRKDTNTDRRPIVFIGHSLGGLLIKEAIIQAHNRSDDPQNNHLRRACYGLLLFGVPNLGLRHEQLQSIIHGQPNELLIRELVVDNDSEPSQLLKRISSDFSRWCTGEYKYKVVSFFERVLSPTVEVQPDGSLSNTGPRILLVTEKSATSTGLMAAADENNVPVSTDHAGLVKFQSRSQNEYSIVRSKLKHLVREARAEVGKRFTGTKNHRRVSIDEYLYQAQSDTDACLKSLAFEDMDGRQANIVDAVDGTCKWLLNHETVIEWTRQHRGILWIKGKPGSGKTTLMKYALDALPSLYGTDTLAISFFFHGRGHELQKNPIGLFRSLLHQLLKRVSGALPDLIHHFEDKRKTEGESGEKWQWHLQPLQAFLKSSLPRILKRFPVMLFIDALDECGEKSAVELIGFLKRLLLSLPPTDYKFGICFSCRHYPLLELDGGSTILLDTENARDIATFVEARFSADLLNAEVGSLIIDRAQGVFMWACMVLEKVLEMHRQGESTGEIRAEIVRVPEDLTGLYHELIKSLKCHSTTLKLIQWICFSTRPLRVEELQWAMAVDPDCSHKSLDDCRNSDDFITDDKIDRRINALSAGLAEIVPSRYNGRIVQFIHQSVEDFFVNGGLMALDNTTKEPALVAPVAHCRLSRTCLRYFKMAANSHTEPFCWQDEPMFPLVHYATTSWVRHVKSGEPAETYPSGLLDLLGWPRNSLIDLWVRTYRRLVPPEVGDHRLRGTNLICVISGYGLVELLLCLLESCGESGGALVNQQDGSGRTPLSWAAGYGHETIVKLLLAAGKVDVDTKDEHGRTPLSRAAANGHVAIIKLLLATGKVDVDTKDEHGWTPLSCAAANGHVAIVKLLLFTGRADADAKDEFGRTPLSWAVVFKRSPIKMDLPQLEPHFRDREAHALTIYQTRLMLLENEYKRLRVARNQMDNAAVVSLLLGTGKVDVNSRDKNGQSPLSLAARTGNAAVVNLLLGTGKVDVNSRDKNGQSPLSLAAELGHAAVAALLLDTGKVDVNSRDKSGRSPLLWAAEGGYDAMVRLLVDTGKVDVDARDMDGKTALLWAEEGKHWAVIRLLVDASKANIAVED